MRSRAYQERILTGHFSVIGVIVSGSKTTKVVLWFKYHEIFKKQCCVVRSLSFSLIMFVMLYPLRLLSLANRICNIDYVDVAYGLIMLTQRNLLFLLYQRVDIHKNITL